MSTREASKIKMSVNLRRRLEGGGEKRGDRKTKKILKK